MLKKSSIIKHYFPQHRKLGDFFQFLKSINLILNCSIKHNSYTYLRVSVPCALYIYISKGGVIPNETWESNEKLCNMVILLLVLQRYLGI